MAAPAAGEPGRPGPPFGRWGTRAYGGSGSSAAPSWGSSQDRGIKLRRYGDLGIPHYWIVDPDAQTVECWALEGGGYRRVVEASVPDVLRHPAWPDLSIDLAALWR